MQKISLVSLGFCMKSIMQMWSMYYTLAEIAKLCRNTVNVLT